jgi:hypothetical protein
MRMRRRFQPILVALSTRVAPSATAVAQPLALVAAHMSATPSATTTVAFDSQIPQNSEVGTLILGPMPYTPPSTLTC